MQCMEAEGRKPSGVYAPFPNPPEGLRRAATIPFTARGRPHASGRAQALRSAVANPNADAGKMADRGTGIHPETLSPAEDVKKVERRLTSVEKKARENPDNLEAA